MTVKIKAAYFSILKSESQKILSQPYVAPHSFYEKWSGNPATSKDVSIVFDNHLGGMLNIAKNDCALLL